MDLAHPWSTLRAVSEPMAGSPQVGIPAYNLFLVYVDCIAIVILVATLWLATDRGKDRRPRVFLILLIALAGALALSRYIPGLREIVYEPFSFVYRHMV